jgi:hypothetical protein
MDLSAFAHAIATRNATWDRPAELWHQTASSTVLARKLPDPRHGLVGDRAPEGTRAVCLTCEVWTVDDAVVGMSPSLHPDRREERHTLALGADGRGALTICRRDSGTTATETHDAPTGSLWDDLRAYLQAPWRGGQLASPHHIWARFAMGKLVGEHLAVLERDLAPSRLSALVMNTLGAIVSDPRLVADGWAPNVHDTWRDVREHRLQDAGEQERAWLLWIDDAGLASSMAGDFEERDVWKLLRYIDDDNKPRAVGLLREVGLEVERGTLGSAEDRTGEP